MAVRTCSSFTGQSLSVCLGLFLSLNIARHSQATVINGGFETGSFPPWTFVGGAGVASGAFGTAPAGGSFHALMESGPSAQSSIAGLETFLGVAAGSIIAFNPNPPGSSLTEGSAIRQTGVTIAAGQFITFDFNFLTDETAVAGRKCVCRPRTDHPRPSGPRWPDLAASAKSSVKRPNLHDVD